LHILLPRLFGRSGPLGYIAERPAGTKICPTENIGSYSHHVAYGKIPMPGGLTLQVRGTGAAAAMAL